MVAPCERLMECKEMKSRASTADSASAAFSTLCLCHHLQLHDTAILLLLKILAPLLHVDVIPRQHFIHGPMALRIERGIDAQVGERLPPDLGLEAFGPAIEPAAAPPGFFQSDRNPAIAARQYAF